MHDPIHNFLVQPPLMIRDGALAADLRRPAPMFGNAHRRDPTAPQYITPPNARKDK